MNGIYFENVSKNEFYSLVQAEIQRSIEAAGLDMLVTTQEAARILGVSTDTVNNYKKRGKLTDHAQGAEHRKFSLREIINLKRNE